MQPVKLVPARRHLRPLVLVEVFAGKECTVSALLEEHGQSTWLESLAPDLTIAASTAGIVQGAMIVRILPGKETSSRRAAERGAGEGVGELRAMTREHLHRLLQRV